ncbi:MAG: high-potential iron-sulfur protein [Steroidobacteraceae bacterium]|jgi:hypothetical protein
MHPTRRALLKSIALGAAALTVARAGDTAHLDETDPAALALGYVEDAGRVNTAKNPGYAPGSRCDNCLQLQGKAGDAYRPCGLFPGKLVSAGGWCKSWTPEI